MTYFPTYDTCGKGRPLLVLNGFGCSNWFMKEIATKLSDHAHWVLSENRGMGSSPKVSEEYTVEDLASDALTLMERLGHETFTLLGYSMGGFIAQALYLMAPERIDGMIMLCATGPGSGFVELPEVTEDMLRASYDIPPEDMIMANLKMTMYPDFEAENPERYRMILERRLKNLADLDQLLLQFRAVQAFIEKPLPLDRIGCPTLILTGDTDRFVSPENSKLLAQAIPSSEYHVIENSDHLFFLEKPEPVSRFIGNFLEKL